MSRVCRKILNSICPDTDPYDILLVTCCQMAVEYLIISISTCQFRKFSTHFNGLFVQPVLPVMVTNEIIG